MPSSGRPYFRTFHRGFRCRGGYPEAPHHAAIWGSSLGLSMRCILCFLNLRENIGLTLGGKQGSRGGIAPSVSLGGSVNGNVNIQLNILMVFDYVDLYHPILRDFACMTHYFQTDRTYIFVGLLSFSLLKSGFRHYTRFHHLKKGIELVPNLELKKKTLPLNGELAMVKQW